MPRACRIIIWVFAAAIAPPTGWEIVPAAGGATVAGNQIVTNDAIPTFGILSLNAPAGRIEETRIAGAFAGMAVGVMEGEKTFCESCRTTASRPRWKAKVRGISEDDLTSIRAKGLIGLLDTPAIGGPRHLVHRSQQRRHQESVGDFLGFEHLQHDQLERQWR